MTTLNIHCNQHLCKCTSLLVYTTAACCPPCNASFEYSLKNIFWASTKGKLLIRRKPIAATVNGDNKQRLLLYSPLFSSLSEISPQSFYPQSPAPPTSPLQSSMVFPLWQKEQERNARGGGMERERSKRPKPPFISAAWLCSFAPLPRFWQTLLLPPERAIKSAI